MRSAPAGFFYYVVTGYQPKSPAVPEAANNNHCRSSHRSFDLARNAARKLSRHVRADIDIGIVYEGVVVARRGTCDLFTGLPGEFDRIDVGPSP
jgi:hypothetical protein